MGLYSGGLIFGGGGGGEAYFWNEMSVSTCAWWAYTRGAYTRGRGLYSGGAYSRRFTVCSNLVSLFLELAKRCFARQNEEIQSEII